MPIPATEPTALNATFDRWAIADFRIPTDGCVAFGGSPPVDAEGNPTAPPVPIVVTLTKYRVRADGTPERSPHPSDIRRFSIPDIYAEAETNPEIADVLVRLTTAVANYAAARGAL